MLKAKTKEIILIYDLDGCVCVCVSVCVCVCACVWMRSFCAIIKAIKIAAVSFKKHGRWLFDKTY